MERSRARRREEEARIPLEEEESDSVAVGIEKLSIETEGMEEEAAEGLEAALGVEIEEDS